MRSKLLLCLRMQASCSRPMPSSRAHVYLVRLQRAAHVCMPMATRFACSGPTRSSIRAATPGLSAGGLSPGTWISAISLGFLKNLSQVCTQACARALVTRGLCPLIYPPLRSLSAARLHEKLRLAVTRATGPHLMM